MVLSNALQKLIELKTPSIQNNLLKWSEYNLRDYPWRVNITPFRILIAEFLLKRTTASAVNRVYQTFLVQYPDLTSIVNSSDSSLEQALVTLGLQKSKTRQIKETCSQLLVRYKGEIPKDFETLIGVKNIGDYTAGAILSLGYGVKAPMVDSNVMRIFGRVFEYYQDEIRTVKKARELVARIIPDKDFAIFNLALLDLGAIICSYRFTKCEICPLTKNCGSSMV